MTRQYSSIDRLLIQVGETLATLSLPANNAARANPANGHKEPMLSDQERRHSAGLMRVDHAGEVAAQGLYQGQALTAKKEHIRDAMQDSAAEEVDHLSWCAERLGELNSRSSRLDPLWYLGALTVGALAGLAGDRWSLGFVAETERQVGEHLQDHLKQLSPTDIKSREILLQMCDDEAAHADKAIDHGAAELPEAIKSMMWVASRIMTTSAYYF